MPPSLFIALDKSQGLEVHLRVMLAVAAALMLAGTNGLPSTAATPPAQEKTDTTAQDQKERERNELETAAKEKQEQDHLREVERLKSGLPAEGPPPVASDLHGAYLGAIICSLGDLFCNLSTLPCAGRRREAAV